MVAFADSNCLDSKLIDLIHEKIRDASVIVELEYNNLDKLSRICNVNSDKISGVRLKSTSSNFTFVASVEYNNVAVDEISGRYNLFFEIPVPTRNIKSGEVIKAEDIRIAKIKFQQLREGLLRSESEVIGRYAKKAIFTGSFFKVVDLANPPTIKSGDPVNLIYSAERIQIKVSGKSLSAGSIGDMIKVQNSDTGVVLLGQIIDKNTVQVGNRDVK
jgi:flagella basal body P-ring formation protein FlgA